MLDPQKNGEFAKYSHTVRRVVVSDRVGGNYQNKRKAQTTNQAHIQQLEDGV